jgi:ABC-2 type transport system ATP-binding protein
MPHEMQSRITITMPGDGEVLIETAELTPLLNWLATLPLSEVQIEPVGLRAIYDQFHEPTTP